MWLLGRLVYIWSKHWACPGPYEMHQQIFSSRFPLRCKSHLLATVVSDVWFEGSLSVRKRDKQIHLFSQNYKVEFICVLFVVWCNVFFCLSYLPFRIDLGRLVPSLLICVFVCVFVFFNPESLWRRCAVAVCARPYQPSPLAPSLCANNAVIVCVPFVIPNHGKKITKKKVKLCSQSFSIAHLRDILCLV